MPPASAGTWYEAGYHMATTIATPAAYSPIPFAFASLTWGGGLSTLIVGIAVTWCVRTCEAEASPWLKTLASDPLCRSRHHAADLSGSVP